MIENYRVDTVSGAFSNDDLSSNKYAKMFSVRKTHGVNLMFSLTQTSTIGVVSYKRLAFISGATPNIYDFDIEALGITVKVFDDGTNYVLYAKIPNTTTIRFKLIQCDIPNLIKFYPGESPVVLPGSGDITNRVISSKSSIYFSILSLITFSWEKQYTTQLILTDGNEISGHLFVKGTQSGDGSQICTIPVPLYINTESMFQTFCAIYQGTDSLWYGCTLRLGSDGSLKVYGLGSNAPSYISIKANIHYRCSVSTINQFLNS